MSLEKKLLNLLHKMENNIKRVLVLVEMEDNAVRQVIANPELKKAYLHFLQEDGVLRVTEEVMPIELEFKDKNDYE